MKFRVKVEIPKGSNVKYEINKSTGQIEVDRIVNTGYPYNYGFIKNTLWEDGDALDAFVIGDFTLHPGIELDATPVAVIKMHDNGDSDYKVLCVLDENEIKYKDFESAKQIIINFLSTYKTGVTIDGCIDSGEEVRSVVYEAAMAFIKHEQGEFA